MLLSYFLDNSYLSHTFKKCMYLFQCLCGVHLSVYTVHAGDLTIGARHQLLRKKSWPIVMSNTKDRSVLISLVEIKVVYKLNYLKKKKY